MASDSASKNDSTAESATPATVWNIPNRLSASRIVLAIACFVTIGLGHYYVQFYFVSLVLFLVAAATDWLDGFWARRFGQVTQLGRILDPFADKVIICGTFIMLCAVPGSEIAPWMAVLVTGRELLVTALRSLCEGRSIDFSARWAGKVKMVFQCVAVALSLWKLSQGENGVSMLFNVALIASVWLSLASTLYSGWGYVRLSAQMMLGETEEQSAE